MYFTLFYIVCIFNFLSCLEIMNRSLVALSFYWSLIIRSLSPFSRVPQRAADRDVEKRPESSVGPLEVLNFHGNGIETARFPALSRHRCSHHVPLTFTYTCTGLREYAQICFLPIQSFWFSRLLCLFFVRKGK